MNELEIKNLRKKLGLTQKKLSELLSVDIKTVQNWESGKAIPKSKLERLQQLSEGVGINTTTATNCQNCGLLKAKDEQINKLLEILEKK